MCTSRSQRDLFNQVQYSELGLCKRTAQLLSHRLPTCSMACFLIYHKSVSGRQATILQLAWSRRPRDTVILQAMMAFCPWLVACIEKKAHSLTSTLAGCLCSCLCLSLGLGRRIICQAAAKEAARGIISSRKCLETMRDCYIATIYLRTWLDLHEVLHSYDDCCP